MLAFILFHYGSCLYYLFAHSMFTCNVFENSILPRKCFVDLERRVGQWRNLHYNHKHHWNWPAACSYVGNTAEILLEPARLSLSMHKPTRELLKEFSWNLISETFLKFQFPFIWDKMNAHFTQRLLLGDLQHNNSLFFQNKNVFGKQIDNEVLTEVVMVIVWDLTTCSSLKVTRCFRGTFSELSVRRVAYLATYFAETSIEFQKTK
jgi:hypothetical protein